MLALCLCASGPATAQPEPRSRIVLGGAASAAYVYTGQRGNNLFSEGNTPNDARFRAGGLLGYGLYRSDLELSVGFYAGAVIAARFERYRNAEVRLNAEAAWHATQRWQLRFELSGEFEPLSSETARLTGNTGALLAAPALQLRPAWRAQYSASRDDRIALQGRAVAFNSTKPDADLQLEEVSMAYSIQTELSWEHGFSSAHSLEGRLFTRFVEARAKANPPINGVVGALAVWEYLKREEFRAQVGAGVARALGTTPYHLGPVEPVLDASLTWRDRLDVWELAGTWVLEENLFLGGQLQRMIRVRGSWIRAPSHRTLRWALEVGYEGARFMRTFPTGTPQGGAGTGVDTQHSIRARTRLYVTLGGPWRFFADLTGLLGVVALGRPNICDPTINGGACANKGLFVHALLGVAYIHSERARDERLLSEVW